MKVVYCDFFVVQIQQQKDVHYFTHIDQVCQFVEKETNIDSLTIEQSLQTNRFYLCNDCHIKMLRMRCSNNETWSILD